MLCEMFGQQSNPERSLFSFSSQAVGPRWADLVRGGEGREAEQGTIFPTASLGLPPPRGYGADGRPLCRFFLQGNCYHGEQCRNSHDVGGLRTAVQQAGQAERDLLNLRSACTAKAHQHLLK